MFFFLMLLLSVLSVAIGQPDEEISIAVVQQYCTIPYASMYIPTPPLNDFAFIASGNMEYETWHHQLVKPLTSQIKWTQSVASFWTNYKGQINVACGVTTATFPLPYNFSTYDISSAELFECMDRTNFRAENPSGKWVSCTDNIGSMFAMAMNAGNWSTVEITMSNYSSWPEGPSYLIPFYSKDPISPGLQDGISKIMADGDQGPWDITGPSFKIPFFLENKYPQGTWLSTNLTASECSTGKSQKVEITYPKDLVRAKTYYPEKTLAPFVCNVFDGLKDYCCPTYLRAAFLD